MVPGGPAAFASPLPTPAPQQQEGAFASPLLEPGGLETVFQSPLTVPKEAVVPTAGRSLQEGWRLVYNPPMVALFSGGATYEYALDLPPTRGNLRPSVRLSYNSRRVDGLLAWVQDWVGIGWSVDLMDVVRDEARYCWPGDSPAICLGERFLLVMNGTAYELEPPPGSPQVRRASIMRKMPRTSGLNSVKMRQPPAIVRKTNTGVKCFLIRA